MDWIKSLEKFLGEHENLLNTLIILLTFIVLRSIIFILVHRQIKEIKRQYHWRKAVSYLLSLITLFLIGRIWFQGFQSVITFLGIFSAGLAIALQDMLVNIAAWFFILWRRPFEVGDRIEINHQKGDVIDRRLFMFTVLEIGNWVNAEQSTGRIIHFPNGIIFKNSLANYSKGFTYIWNEIPVMITFESDWEKAKQILVQIANTKVERLSAKAEKSIQKAARRFMIYYHNLTPIVYTTVADSGVVLTIRYLCEPKTRRNSEEILWEEILRQFKQHKDIDFAYPTTRIYRDNLEGKNPKNE